MYKYQLLILLVILNQSCGLSESYNRDQASACSDEHLVRTHDFMKQRSLGLGFQAMQAKIIDEEIKKRGIVGSGSLLSKISKNPE
jgi:hypothetical protein